MRLFIAINFNEEIKKRLHLLQQAVKEAVHRGNFTRVENLHLTLAFLGETPPMRLTDIKDAMKTVTVQPFEITASGIGCFNRHSGAILWVGITRLTSLDRLHQQLTVALARQGFPVEKRSYSPHLTIAREAVLKQNMETLIAQDGDSLVIAVESISLMCSARKKGMLTYTEIYRHNLKPT